MPALTDDYWYVSSPRVFLKSISLKVKCTYFLLNSSIDYSVLILSDLEKIPISGL